MSAQPAQIGKGGRAIRGGRGSRGGQSSAGRGQSHQPVAASGRGVPTGGNVGGRGQGRGDRGRGGRGRGRSHLPRGVGVLFTEDGSAITNVCAMIESSF